MRESGYGYKCQTEVPLLPLSPPSRSLVRLEAHGRCAPYVGSSQRAAKPPWLGEDELPELPVLL